MSYLQRQQLRVPNHPRYQQLSILDQERRDLNQLVLVHYSSFKFLVRGEEGLKNRDSGEKQLLLLVLCIVCMCTRTRNGSLIEANIKGVSTIDNSEV